MSRIRVLLLRTGLVGTSVGLFALLSLAASPLHAARTGQSDDFKLRILARTNMYRLQYGCPALVMNDRLMQAAQGHSDDMALRDYFSHTGLDGSTLTQRIQNAGYSFMWAGENIAGWNDTPEAVVDRWFDESPPNDPHRKNILKCAYQEIGIGHTYLENDVGSVRVHHYWVQDFGQPGNLGVAAAAPAPTAVPPPSPATTTTPCDLHAPVPGTTVANQYLSSENVTIEWENVPCATRYRLLVRLGAPNGVMAQQKGGLGVSQYTLTPLSKSTTYYWSVRACNELSCERSEWRTFTLQ